MIKTAQDAYLAGRQVAMEKVALNYASQNANVLAANLGLNGLGYEVAGTAAGTGLGTYLGDQNLRSAGISAAGALGGGQIGSNLALAGISALRAAKGLDNEANRRLLGSLNMRTAPAIQARLDLNDEQMKALGAKAMEMGELHRLSRKILGTSNLLGQLAGGAAAGHYTKRG